MDFKKGIYYSFGFVLLLFLIVLCISFVSSAVYSNTDYYVGNPENCPKDGSVYSSLPFSTSCKPTNICGEDNQGNFCYNLTSISNLANNGHLPSQNVTKYNTRGSYSVEDSNSGGGFVVDCVSDDGTNKPGPACTNNDQYWCRTIDQCDSDNRKTKCLEGKFAFESNSAVCTSTCADGYTSCSGPGSTAPNDDADGCETDFGTGTGADSPDSYNDGNGGQTAVYNNSQCDTSCPDGWLDNDSNITNGCEIEIGGDCTVDGVSGTYNSNGVCVPDKSKFETGTEALYSTGSNEDAMLWFKNFDSDGDLINATNSIGESWRINNNSCIVLKDNTTICDKGDVGGNTSWNLSGNDLYPEDTDYNLGIGTDSVTDTLTVNGTANITGNVTSGKDFCIQGGKCLSETGTGSGDIAAVLTGNTPYLYNGSTSGSVSLNFNETYLNNTIDVSVNNSAFTSVTGDYLINNSGTLDFNETELNNTIDSRSSGGSGNSVWNLSGVRVYPESTNYNVSIGTNRTYGNRLQVNGSVNVTGNITSQSDVCAGGNCLSNVSGGSGGAVPSAVNLTANKYNGSIKNGSKVGYTAANAICNQEFGNAHLCSEAEILRAHSEGNVGLGSGFGWVFSGGAKYFPVEVRVDDCRGFTSDREGDVGNFWRFNSSDGGVGAGTNCNTNNKIACCSYKQS